MRVYSKLEKDVKDFHVKVKEKIRNLIMELETNPVPVHGFDISKVKGMDSVYRARITYARVPL